MEVAMLARLQQKVAVFDSRQPLVKSAASLEHLAPHHELARHDVPRTLEQLLHRRRRGALRLPVESSDLTALQIDLEAARIHQRAFRLLLENRYATRQLIRHPSVVVVEK